MEVAVPAVFTDFGAIDGIVVIPASVMVERPDVIDLDPIAIPPNIGGEAVRADAGHGDVATAPHGATPELQGRLDGPRRDAPDHLGLGG